MEVLLRIGDGDGLPMSRKENGFGYDPSYLRICSDGITT